MRSRRLPTGGLRLRPSVRARITLAAVLGTAAAVGVAGWGLIRASESTQLAQVRDDLNADIDRVVERLESGASVHDAIAATTQDETARTVTLQISDEDGNVLGPELPGPDGDAPDGGQTLEARTDNPADTGPDNGDVQPPRDDGQPEQGATIGIQVASQESVTREITTPEGPLVITASTPVDQVERGVDFLRGTLLVGLPVLVGLVGVTAWVLVGRALRPVEAIRAEVDAIGGTTTHKRVPEPATSDEIGRLARTMNAMLGRLDRAATRQRQFVADASHELRSPVAAIRTQLEVAQRNPDQADWSAVAETALAEEGRLEALLDDLLLLAALDENGSSHRTTASVDLRALVATEAERTRRVPVRVGNAAGTAPLLVAGDAERLTRVVSNLLDNAARHADTEAHVSAEPGDMAGTVLLRVDDDGPGIPADDRERVFERFTRLDSGRARDDGGAGLGLAIVRSIVASHNSRVWATASPLGGARLCVELPRVS